MNTLNLIYYSPTGTTQKVIREIGQNVGINHIIEHNIAEDSINLTPKSTDNSLTIIGLPVYSGRLPITVIEKLKNIKANQSPVVIVVVYGNREFDDSLLELKEIASNCGFKIVAGAAFIGEHSFSSNDKPIAKDRPDKNDLEKCKDFAKMVTEKIKSENTFSEPHIPGNYPYKERKQSSAPSHPETENNICTKCGICVDVCPTNAITIQETVITNGDLCTLCCACVKNCPENARTIDNPTINAIQERLFLNCSIRKEPEYFL